MSPINNKYSAVFSETMLHYAVIENCNREMALLPSEEELSRMYTFSKHHEDRMKKLFRRERRREHSVAIFRIGRRVAVFIAVMGTLIFGVLLINPEVRAAVVNTVTEWFEQFTRYTFNDDTPSNINIAWSPKYLPEGFVESGRYEIGAGTYFDYSDDQGNDISFSFAKADSISAAVDNEEMKFSLIVENGIDYHVYSSELDEKPSKIIWFQEGYAMSLSGYCEISELLKMARSVKK